MGNLLHLVLKAWQLNDIKTESNLYPNCTPGKKTSNSPVSPHSVPWVRCLQRKLTNCMNITIECQGGGVIFQMNILPSFIAVNFLQYVAYRNLEPITAFIVKKYCKLQLCLYTLSYSAIIQRLSKITAPPPPLVSASEYQHNSTDNAQLTL